MGLVPWPIHSLTYSPPRGTVQSLFAHPAPQHLRILSPATTIILRLSSLFSSCRTLDNTSPFSLWELNRCSVISTHLLVVKPSLSFASALPPWVTNHFKTIADLYKSSILLSITFPIECAATSPCLFLWLISAPASYKI